jgi:hypothetical protein
VKRKGHRETTTIKKAFNALSQPPLLDLLFSTSSSQPPLLLSFPSSPKPKHNANLVPEDKRLDAAEKKPDPWRRGPGTRPSACRFPGTRRRNPPLRHRPSPAAAAPATLRRRGVCARPGRGPAGYPSATDLGLSGNGALSRRPARSARGRDRLGCRRSIPPLSHPRTGRPRPTRRSRSGRCWWRGLCTRPEGPSLRPSC